MKAEVLRSRTASVLKEQLLGLKREQLNLRFQKTSGQLENTARIRAVRRDVARIKTILADFRSGGGQTAGDRDAGSRDPSDSSASEE